MLLLRIGLTLLVLYGLFVALVAFAQRSLIYFPAHDRPSAQFRPWVIDGGVCGWFRAPAQAEPRAVWLMLHGNAGDAGARDYVLPLLARDEAFYVLEYPGYGARPGAPSRAALDAAAVQAYTTLRTRYPGRPICVLGESLGSGPASMLAREPTPPDKIVLVVPFARLADVAAEQFWFIPARWILRDRWDNVAALGDYRGRLEIYGALHDRVIPFRHAKALADALPRATFHTLPTGHNSWSSSGRIKLAW